MSGEMNALEHMEECGLVVLTAEQAEEICDVLIGMAERLPLKYRDHGKVIVWLRWYERRGIALSGGRAAGKPPESETEQETKT